MEIKILQVFLGEDNLPYKDKERTVHFPIVGAAFKGASNTTKIRFYYDKLVEQDDEDTTTWVAVSKLPNGKIGSKVLEREYDEELEEHYALFELESFYTQYKGDLFISLQGYQGGVQVITDQDTGISQIVGTPTIQATGSIKLAINYATQFIGSGETSNVNFQRILADLGTKLGIRTLTERVDELPTIGQTNVFYVVPDTSDTNKVNIYVWNGTTQSYVWVGDNSLYLGDYYTKQEGEQFESDIDNRVTSVETELSSVASGSPKGVYATLEDLQAAYPTGTEGIYVVNGGTYAGHWFYWNGSAWTDGGTYISSLPDNELDDTSNNSVENQAVCKGIKTHNSTFDRVVKTLVDFSNAVAGPYTPNTKVFFKDKTYIIWRGVSPEGSAIVLTNPSLETGVEYVINYSSNQNIFIYTNEELSSATTLSIGNNLTQRFTISQGTTPRLLLIAQTSDTSNVELSITINKADDNEKNLEDALKNINKELIKSTSVTNIKVTGTPNLELSFSDFDYPTNRQYDGEKLSWNVANGIDGGYNIDIVDLDMSKYLNVSFDYSANNYPEHLYVWLGVIDNNDNRSLVALLKDINSEDSASFEIDTSHYAVYNNAKSLYLIINTSTVNADTTILLSNFVVNQNEAQNLPISAKKLDGTLKNISVKLTELDEREISAEIDLISPNGTKYVLTVANDGTLVTQKVIPQKALFIGNSLTLGFGTFGMCASNNTKDYYKKFNDYILTKEPSYTATRYINGGMVSGYSFEDSATEEQCLAWITNALLPVLSNDLDLVVLQLGDNSAIGGTVLYNNCVNTIRAVRNNCPKARVVFMSAWYTNTDRQTQIQNACKATGAVFVNIFGLAANGGTNAVGNVVTMDSDQTTTYTCTYSDDAENNKLTLTIDIGGSTYHPTINYTSYIDNGNGTITVIGPDVVITNDGIASHPGDVGMLRIANKLAYELGIISQEGEIE